jgi:hypothetical protein
MLTGTKQRHYAQVVIHIAWTEGIDQLDHYRFAVDYTFPDASCGAN